MGRNYDRLSIEEFGAHLLDTGDLDPIYIALHKMELDNVTLSKWLVAYWCYYHAGVACHMATMGKDAYWQEMMRAAQNIEPAPTGGRWPRGHERRHFRGAQATDGIFSLQARHPSGPADMVAGFPALLGLGPVPFKEISDRAQEERGFGPWISFKIADMLDRLDICPVSFEQAEVFMFKDPTEAALRLWRLKAGLNETAMPKDKTKAITEVVNYLKLRFKDYTAPPRHERPVGLQEVETILCKWKSHMNGHYPLQNDTIEITAGVREWDHNPIAHEFYGHMKEMLDASGR
jgi:hypothetical protein